MKNEKNNALLFAGIEKRYFLPRVYWAFQSKYGSFVQFDSVWAMFDHSNISPITPTLKCRLRASML